MNKSRLIGALGIVAMSLLLPSSGAAYPAYRRLFKVSYGKPVSCAACHTWTGGTERNAYGLAWHQKGESLAAFKMIEALDSDGDAVANVVEIQAGSNPGDKRSTPEAPGAFAATTVVDIPQDQLSLVVGPADMFEAVEADLTSEQVKVVGREIQADLDVLDRVPTLYLGSQDGKRTTVAMFTEFRLAEGPFSLLVGMGVDGKVKKVAVFRAGAKTGADYASYLACWVGRGKADASPRPGLGGCAPFKGNAATLNRMNEAVRKVLWTVAVLFGKDAGTP